MPGNNLQAFPRLNSPVVDLESGLLTVPWYRFFISLWQRLGGSANAFPISIFGQQSGNSALLFNAQTGAQIGPGPISFGVLTGLAQQTLIVGASPTTLTLASAGMLVISGGGQIEVRRPPANYVIASVTGGTLWLLPGDQVRLTWFAGPPPTATLLPFTVS